MIDNPPKQWLKRSVSPQLTEARIRELLSEGLDHAFGQIGKSFNPQITLVYKDVTYSTIVSDNDFREALTKQFGEEAIGSLFEEYDASREKKTPRKMEGDLA